MKRKLPDGGIPGNPQTTLRLHPDEKQKALEAAERDGFKSLSTWIKHQMRRRIAEQQQFPEGWRDRR